MKVDFQTLATTKVGSIFLYSTHESYLTHRLNSLIQALSACRSIKTEWIDVTTLINDPGLLHNQGDLFAPVTSEKLIIVQDPTDRAAKILEEHLAAPNPGVCLVFPAIVGASIRKLKAIHEKENQAAFTTCYLGNVREKQQFLSDLIAEYKLKLTREAQTFSLQHMDEDLEALLNAFYKLSLFVINQEDEVTLKDLEDCLADFREASVHPLITQIGDRHLANALRTYHEAKLLGAEEMMLIRGLNIHFSKLMQLRAKVSAGTPASQAMQSMRPPIFFKQQDEFRRHIMRWTEPEIVKLMEVLNTIEYKIKTGYSFDPVQLWKPVFSMCKAS